MRFSLAVAALASALSVSAENILVTVGAGGLLAFNPPNITANVGDVVAFQFQAKNHSVTQSTFASPCSIQTTPAQGVDSGFQFVAANATELPEWSFTINNASAPLWFFCAQTIPANHCEAGMVFSVNANPDSAKSFAVYQANAKASGNAAAAAGSAIASGAAAATAAIGSAVGGAVSDATSLAGSIAGAAATGAAAALTNAAAAGAAALTGSSAAPSASANSTSAPSSGGRVTSSAVSMLAVVGLAAGLLL